MIETFDPQAVKGLLGTGNLVLLIGIAPDGYMTVYELPDNPIKHVDGEPVETSTGVLAELALAATLCGCKNGKRCVRSGNICVQGAVACTPAAPPCS